MSSSVQLLALLAAFLRCGAAEGDPLPVALVELVRSTPISSVEDLQLLLLSDSVDDDQDGFPGNGAHSNTSNRLPRSLDAQPAQQALCKTRTEVVEVTRAMLDRSNANFLLWPPCVEVQRCSGCCNTKTLQCVPALTHTRYLQVMKIEYVNKRPSYAKAVVSVLDHVECQCQPAPRGPSAPKKKPSSRRQQTNAKDLRLQQHHHTNQTHAQTQGGEGAKPWPKEELHRRDELKDNQRVQLEELLEQHPWGPRGDTFTQAQGGDGSPEGYTLAGEDTASLSGERGSPHWVRNATRLLGTADSTEPWGGGRTEERRGGRRGVGFNDSETVSLNRTAVVGFDLAVRYKGSGRGGGGGGGGRGGGRSSNSTGSEEARQGGRSNSEEKEEGQNKKHSLTDSSAPLPDRPKIPKSQRTTTESAYQTPESRLSPTEPTNQRRENRFRPTEVTNQGTAEQTPQEAEGYKRRDNQTPEEESRIRKAERERMEEEKELLLLHNRLDEEKERLRQQQALKQREEEEEKERRRYRSQITTQTAVTAPPTSTEAPTVPAVHRPPVRPNPPRKRTRKNRKRISKAAMRAMLM